MSVGKMCIGWDEPLFVWAIKARELAGNGLDLLQQATPKELIRMAAYVRRFAYE